MRAPGADCRPEIGAPRRYAVSPVDRYPRIGATRSRLGARIVEIGWRPRLFESTLHPFPVRIHVRLQWHVLCFKHIRCAVYVSVNCLLWEKPDSGVTDTSKMNPFGRFNNAAIGR